MSITTHKMDMDECPTCGMEATGASETTSKGKPVPGDISICIECGQILIFDEELKLQVCSGPTLNQLDDETLATINKVRTIILQRKRSNEQSSR